MDITVQVPDETGKVVKGLIGFIRAIKVALADGWQPGEDLPALMTAAITNLGPALSSIDDIGAEARANPEQMIVLAGILASEIYQAVA